MDATTPPADADAEGGKSDAEPTKDVPASSGTADSTDKSGDAPKGMSGDDDSADDDGSSEDADEANEGGKGGK